MLGKASIHSVVIILYNSGDALTQLNNIASVSYMRLEKYLVQVGVHPQQARVYAALLDLGTGTASDLVRATKLHRPVVYQALDGLLAQSLITFSPKKRGKVYAAESPEKLQQQLDKLTQQFNEILPELKQRYSGNSRRPQMKYFAGEDVVTAVYEDVLATCQKGDMFYRYESPKDYKKFDEWLPPAYFERICHRKEIDKWVITNEKTKRTKKRVLERIERAVPDNFDPFEYDITQIIYNHKVAWIIESPRFAKFQRQLFKLLFQRLEHPA
jgi:predicted DNA-binding transcriptional regulator